MLINLHKNNIWLKEALNLPHSHVQPIAVCDVNIHSTVELILGNRFITVHDTAPNSGISILKC
jgi:hypothetical protein